MKILISGSRKLTDNTTYTQLEKLLRTLQKTHILPGGAKGVDMLADRYNSGSGMPDLPPKHGRWVWQDQYREIGLRVLLVSWNALLAE